MSASEIEALIDAAFPQARAIDWKIDSVDDGRALLSLAITDEHLRPGGTVSGPTIMAMADTAMYFALLATIGPTALAVTTSLHIDFLRRADAPVLSFDAEVLKLGKQLAVGRVSVRTDDDTLVAHATLTYSIPPAR